MLVMDQNRQALRARDGRQRQQKLSISLRLQLQLHFLHRILNFLRFQAKSKQLETLPCYDKRTATMAPPT